MRFSIRRIGFAPPPGRAFISRPCCFECRFEPTAAPPDGFPLPTIGALSSLDPPRRISRLTFSLRFACRLPRVRRRGSPRRIISSWPPRHPCVPLIFDLENECCRRFTPFRKFQLDGATRVFAGKCSTRTTMTVDMLRGVIPEFADAETEATFRRCSVSENVHQARVALWAVVVTAAFFALNDVRQPASEFESVMQFGLRSAVVLGAACVLLRLRRPIAAATLQCWLLAWAIVIDMLAIAEGVASLPNLLAMQTVLFGLVTSLPLRFVPSAINGACVVLGLAAILRWRCAATWPLLYPLSITMGSVLAVGLQQVWRAERMRRQEFARMRRDARLCEELRRAKEAAEAADEAKSTLLAVVSHEVRIPMNGVLGVLQLLEGSPLDALQRRQVSIARDCAEHLIGVLDGLVDYMCVDAAIDASTPTDFDPRQLVQGAVELVRPYASARETRIDVFVEHRVPQALHADAARLRQVLMNLLSNAVKFTERGRIGVSLAMRECATGKRQLEIVVDDTGIGIPEHMLTRIFDEFVQADASIGRRFGGTGLGLALCRRILERLGGTIAAASEYGAGSRFRVIVPVAVAAPGPQPPVSEAPASRRLKLLVIDDDPINQIVICGLLTQAGHHATPVSGADAAVAEIASGHFDAVFLDLHMPCADGIETARRLRAGAARSRRLALPIVVLTADVLRARHTDVVQAFTSILVKPVRQDALRRVLALVGDAAGPPRPADGIGSTDAAVDLACLNEHAQALGVATLGWLVHRFRSTGRRLRRELGEAVAQRNARRIGELSHRLASSAAALGLPRLRQRAEHLRQAAARQPPPDLSALLIALDIEFECAFDALRDIACDARRERQAPRLTAASSR
ncbi:ATP-binding protein [Burkholderia pseudomallei]|uniref:ATP-binding protein n=1 Tax=Burkholderia pseudomallei TaxID=28450 RepID=UPI000415EE6F|nr:ATP-binding protein [Burkholderia pseudomallei]